MKKFLCSAVMAVVALTSVGAVMPANATDNGTVHYDINNKAYIEKVSQFKEHIPFEEQFVEYLNSLRIPVGFSEDGVNIKYYSPTVAKHVYGSFDGRYDLNNQSFVVEDENNFGERTFTTTVWFWEHYFRNNDELVEKYTVEEINEFLSNQGFKAHIEAEVTERSGKTYYNMKYDEKDSENIVGAFLALNKQFGAELEGFGLVSESIAYGSEPDLSLT